MFKFNFIIGKHLKLYTEKDKETFIDWVRRIPFVIMVNATEDEIVVEYDDAKICEDGLQELLALYRRYKISLKYLYQFLKDVSSSIYPTNSVHKNVYRHRDDMIEKNVLILKRVSFYSRKDEDAFFAWIKAIECIEKFVGVGDELHLYITANNLHDADLRDLLALFFRYKIDMKQLSIFLTHSNESWFFDNKKAYWHKKIFGNGSR